MKIKVCPICGSEAKCRKLYGNLYDVTCSNCGLRLRHSNKDKCIDTWNTRFFERTVEPEVNEIVGVRIEHIRKKRDFSQRELALRAGVTWHIINAIENGKCIADYDMIVKLADGLGVSCDFLLRGKEKHVE